MLEMTCPVKPEGNQNCQSQWVSSHVNTCTVLDCLLPLLIRPAKSSSGTSRASKLFHTGHQLSTAASIPTPSLTSLLDYVCWQLCVYVLSMHASSLVPHLEILEVRNHFFQSDWKSFLLPPLRMGTSFLPFDHFKTRRRKGVQILGSSD